MGQWWVASRWGSGGLLADGGQWWVAMGQWWIASQWGSGGLLADGAVVGCYGAVVGC